jgi:PAS domain S-box-containing protein
MNDRATSVAPVESELRRQEEAFEVLRLRSRALTDNATTGLVLMDARQHCIFLNPAAERIFGLTFAQLQGKPLHDFVHHTRPDGTHFPMSECPIDRALPTRMQETGEDVFVRPDGTFYPVAFTASPVLENGVAVGTVIEVRDITEQRKAQEREAQRVRQAALIGDIGGALTRGQTLRAVLQDCAEAIVRHVGAAFARVWTLDDAQQVLELQASAGRYTHLDGAHARVPVGKFKIGLIAEEGHPHLTNDVPNDPRVGDREWARREKMISFAGYPLKVQGRVIGVLAMFAQQPLRDDTLELLAAVSDSIALGVERMRVEAMRRESETRYRMATRATKDAIWDWDLVTNGVVWNEGIHELFHYREGEVQLTATWWIEHIHPEDRERVVHGIHEVIDAPDRFHWHDEYRYQRTDGSFAQVTDRGWVVRDAHGKPLRMVGAMQDVTDQRKAQAALQQSEERLRRVVEASGAGTWEADLATNQVTADPRLLALFGLPADTQVSLDVVMSGIHPDDRARVGEAISAATEGKNEGRYVAEFRTMGPGDGHMRWVEGRGQAFFDGSGKAVRLLGTGIDITARKNAEEEIHRLNAGLEERVRERTAQLEAANRELEAFSYSVSHDLRAPLRHIAGFAEMLERRAARSLDDRSRGYLKTITEAAKKGGQLVDDLLAFSRLGRAEVTKTAVPLAALVEELQRDLAPEWKGRSVSWKLGPLPTVEADPGLLRSALRNLMSNALKYSRLRAEAVIEIGASSSDREVEIFVKDNGIGFDMEHAQKLFGVFQRLHTSEQFEGTGIGLANVRRIIQKHGGRVWAQGALDAGATFWFALPRSAPQAR